MKSHFQDASICPPSRSWTGTDKARSAKAQACDRLERVFALNNDIVPSLVHFLPILGQPLERSRQARLLIEGEPEWRN